MRRKLALRFDYHKHKIGLVGWLGFVCRSLREKFRGLDSVKEAENIIGVGEPAGKP